MNRRHALRLFASSAALAALPLPVRAQRRVLSGAETAGYKLSFAELAFLDELERRACMFFVDQASPTTGQVLDRARAFDPPGLRDSRRMASIAATGFGLAALCIADSRDFVPHNTAIERVRSTLRFHR
ncbi:MAG TPA: hypothetical protein VGM11_10450, partial [Acidobacteriaceae bacterium]